MARRPSAPTRLAKVYTWQPATRVEQTVLRRRLPFTGDARDLLARAAALVAPLRPWRVDLCFLPRRRHLGLNCGADAQGVQTHISITLHADDAWLVAYFARDRSVSCLLFVDFPDDGDGEDLVLPRVSVDDLARMPATIGVQHPAGWPIRRPIARPAPF